MKEAQVCLWNVQLSEDICSSCALLSSFPSVSSAGSTSVDSAVSVCWSAGSSGLGLKDKYRINQQAVWLFCLRTRKAKGGRSSPDAVRGFVLIRFLLVCGFGVAFGFRNFFFLIFWFSVHWFGVVWTAGTKNKHVLKLIWLLHVKTCHLTVYRCFVCLARWFLRPFHLVLVYWSQSCQWTGALVYCRLQWPSP